MDIGGKLTDVPKGHYRVVWRLKPSRFTWHGTFNSGPRRLGRSVFLDPADGTTEIELPYEDHPPGYTQHNASQCALSIERSNGRKGQKSWRPPSLVSGQWTRLVVGELKLASPTTEVHLRVTGGSPNWTPSVFFDYVALERIQLPFEVVLVLLLINKYRADHPLAILNEDCLRHVIDTANLA
jgi:hypothetical protein